MLKRQSGEYFPGKSFCNVDTSRLPVQISLRQTCAYIGGVTIGMEMMYGSKCYSDVTMYRLSLKNLNVNLAKTIFFFLMKHHVTCVAGYVLDIVGSFRQAVSKTGGHLGSSLGVIELTVALHYVFDAPEDKITWDVSHQVKLKIGAQVIY